MAKTETTRVKTPDGHIVKMKLDEKDRHRFEKVNAIVADKKRAPSNKAAGGAKDADGGD